MRNLTRLLVVAAILIASAWAPVPVPAAEPSAAASPGTLPPRWDKRIPLPPGAVMLSSTTPKEGVVYSADFAAPGSYDELVKFYETELAKAGFKMGPKVAIPARKVYNRTFTWTQILDSVVITPSTADPSKMNVHVTYTPLPDAK
jgi:hypothetical protein